MVENSRSFEGCYNFPPKKFVYWKLEDNAKNIFKSFLLVIPLHCYTNTLIWFVMKLMIANLKTHQIHRISG